MFVSQPAVAIMLKCLIFLNVVLVPAVFRMREFGDDSMDFQILIKLGVWLGTFLFCGLFISKWGGKLWKQDNWPVALLLVLMAFSCIYAPSVIYSAGCVLSILALICLFCMATQLMEEEEILRIVIYGLSLISALSIAMYFINPSFARMMDWVNGVQVLGRRLTGVTGSANNIGFISAFALLLMFVHRRFYEHRRGWGFWLLVGVHVTALFMSDSRTSLAALLVTVCVARFWRFGLLHMAVFFLGIALVMLCVMVMDTEILFALFSRSGDAGEIMTATGRTHIWTTVLYLIEQKPLLGWGYASSSFILPAYEDMIGHVPPHAHNIYLQLWFSVGIIGLVLFMIFLAAKTAGSLKRRDYARLTLLLFFFITGLTESSVFLGVASTPAILFALIISLDYRNTHAARYRTHQ